MPAAREKIRGSAPYVGIAGYSLAGLFALYAMYRCDCFARVASMSGSLWFPKFREYVLRHEPIRKPEKLYMSLGDAEAKTKHAVLKTVQENTEAILQHYQELGVDVRCGAEPRKSLPGRGDAKRKRYQSDTGSVIASGSPRLEITGMMQEKYGM